MWEPLMAQQFSRQYSNWADTKIIQKLLDFRPRVLKYVLCYLNHSVPYAVFKMLKIVVSDFAEEVLHTTLDDKIQCGLD
jgi:hypothetical protein